MSKKNKKYLKKMGKNKSIKSSKKSIFYIRKSLIIALLSSCTVLLWIIYNSSYASNNVDLRNSLIKSHFQKTAIVENSNSKIMSDVLLNIENIQKLENRYIEIMKLDMKNDLWRLSKLEISNKLTIINEKLKSFTYEEIIKDEWKKEKYAQLSALKKILYWIYIHNHYSKYIDIDTLLEK